MAQQYPNTRNHIADCQKLVKKGTFAEPCAALSQLCNMVDRLLNDLENQPKPTPAEPLTVQKEPLFIEVTDGAISIDAIQEIVLHESGNYKIEFKGNFGVTLVTAEDYQHIKQHLINSGHLIPLSTPNQTENNETH